MVKVYANPELLPMFNLWQEQTNSEAMSNQFSQRRMDNELDKLRDVGLIREGGQRSLFSF